MTSEEVCVRIDFGSITIGNALPGTVTLAVDDRIGAQRVLALQIDQAYQVIDGLQNAIRDALANPAPFEWGFVTCERVCVLTDFGSITIGNELPDTVALTVDDSIGEPRVLVLRIDQAYRVIDGLQNAIRYALANPSSTCPSE